MPALAALLRQDQAAKLTALQAQLLTAPPARAAPTAAVCPTCGTPRAVPAAIFRTPSDQDMLGTPNPA